MKILVSTEIILDEEEYADYLYNELIKKIEKDLHEKGAFFGRVRPFCRAVGEKFLDKIPQD